MVKCRSEIVDDFANADAKHRIRLSPYTSTDREFLPAPTELPLRKVGLLVEKIEKVTMKSIEFLRGPRCLQLNSFELFKRSGHETHLTLADTMISATTPSLVSESDRVRWLWR